MGFDPEGGSRWPVDQRACLFILEGCPHTRVSNKGTRIFFSSCISFFVELLVCLAARLEFFFVFRHSQAPYSK